MDSRSAAPRQPFPSLGAYSLELPCMSLFLPGPRLRKGLRPASGIIQAIPGFSRLEVSFDHDRCFSSRGLPRGAGFLPLALRSAAGARLHLHALRHRHGAAPQGRRANLRPFLFFSRLCRRLFCRFHFLRRIRQRCRFLSPPESRSFRSRSSAFLALRWHAGSIATSTFAANPRNPASGADSYSALRSPSAGRPVSAPSSPPFLLSPPPAIPSPVASCSSPSIPQAWRSPSC